MNAVVAIFRVSMLCFSATLLRPVLAQECEHSFAALGSGTAGGLTYPAVLAGAAYAASTAEPALLYLGGNFTHAGDAPVNSVATWDGTAWAPLISPRGQIGVGGGQVVTSVHAIAVFDPDARGPQPPALVVGGDFTTAGDVPASHIAQWNGADWSSLGEGVDWGDFAAVVRALAVFDEDGDGPRPPALFVGGDFTHAGALPVRFLARWDGANWSDVGGGVNATVSGFGIFDDGSGAALYLGGNFTVAGTVDARFVARWDGSRWSALGSGVNASVRALTVFDDGRGADLYAGGYFDVAGDVAAHLVARWDGASWSPVGQGLGSSQLFPGIEAMAVYDDGQGEDLYVTGQFTNADGGSAINIASWNGFDWSAVDGGVGAGDTAASGRSLAAYLGDLYVGGNFTQAGEGFANNIAKWNGCPPSCPADLFPIDAPNGFVGRGDAVAMFGSWGDCTAPCAADLFPVGAPDGVVDARDLGELLTHHGPCP